MIIGIEAERANSPQKTGVEHYAKQLILHLAAIDRENEYVLYVRTRPEKWFFDLPKNFRVKVMPFPIFWTQIRISLEMLFNPVDVLFIPASALPCIHPKKTVVTIHDIAWEYYPQSFTWFTYNFLKLSTWFALKFASNIISVSEATKKDLVKHYEVEPEKITVVHHGFTLESSAQLIGKNENQLDYPQWIKQQKPYVLFLSTLQPRKNLEGLIDAFRLLKTQHPELPHMLVVIGKSGWKFESILKKIEENKDIVIYLNHVTEVSKTLMLSRAAVLALPSFYEGFGMQILEAFAANVPVITSNVSSMPEVAQDAAVYFNPKNIQEIKSALSAVLFDKSLADQLREKGKQRLKEFSWEKCARETLEVFNKL